MRNKISSVAWMTLSLLHVGIEEANARCVIMLKVLTNADAQW